MLEIGNTFISELFLVPNYEDARANSLRNDDAYGEDIRFPVRMSRDSP